MLHRRTPRLGAWASLALISLALGSLLGCEEGRLGIYENEPNLSRPYALDAYLYYLDRGRGRLLVVDPAGEGDLLRADEAVETAAVAPLLLPRRGPERATGLAMLEPNAHRLVLVTERWQEGRALPSVELLRLPLSQLYDALAPSPDGRYLIAYYTGNVRTRDFVTVSGKVAVVDLERAFAGEGSAAVVEQALDLEQSPSRVVVSGPLTLSDPNMPLPAATCLEQPSETEAVEIQDRHLAAIVTEGRMALLDLENPELRARTLIFDAGVSPDRLLFADDPDGHPRVLFNNSRTLAITSLTVSLSREKHACPANEADKDVPEIVVDYVELPIEVAAGDLAVLRGADGLPTVVAPGRGSQRASVLELRGSMMGSTVELSASVSRVLALQDSDGRDVALMWTPGMGTQVTLLRLVDEQGQSAVSVTYPKPFDSPVASVELVPGNRTRVLIHLANSALVEVLDVDTARATVASLLAPAQDSVFSSTGGELFLVSGAQMGGGDDYLVSLSLGEGRELGSQSMLLDYSPISVDLLEGRGLLVVDHGEPFGRLTVVPVGDLRREAAWMLDGIFLNGILEEGR